jgi:hypothetical protein
MKSPKRVKFGTKYFEEFSDSRLSVPVIPRVSGATKCPRVPFPDPETEYLVPADHRRVLPKVQIRLPFLLVQSASQVSLVGSRSWLMS